MNVDQRIDILAELGAYLLSTEPAWLAAQRRAHAANGWFTPEFIGLSVQAIATRFLKKEALQAWVDTYLVPDEPVQSRTVGLTMAGNIPLVGFHDFLSVFISGHHQLIRPSSKDDVLIHHLVEHLYKLDPSATQRVAFAERLNGCDAYIATGNNNSARYFEYYFAKYPHIIRRNRTSVALLTGEESRHELDGLANDVYQYFGLGCRNVTQLYVPENYDFLSLLQAFRKYNYLAQLPKYKHNYDYQLTLLILNKKPYMSNESILLTENSSPFSPISVLHYAYYRPGEPLPAEALPGETLVLPEESLSGSSFAGQPLPPGLSISHSDIQCLVGRRSPANVPFGQAQQPGLEDYADGIDTLKFLLSLS